MLILLESLTICKLYVLL